MAQSKRSWDLDEARSLRKSDPITWTFKALGERYGVSSVAIFYWFNPETRNANQTRFNARQRWKAA